jgi:hypothetical protein
VRQDLGIAATATSNAVFTAREVAASVEEVLEVESESCTAPELVVEAAAIETSGVVPAVTEMGKVPVTAVTADPLETAVMRP